MWRRRRIFLVIIWVVGLSLPVIVLAQGERQETQFSPDSFQHRMVRTYAIPFTDTTVLAIPKDAYNRFRIVQFWIDEGYLVGSLQKPSRWDIVGGWQSRVRKSYKGPASEFWAWMAADSASLKVQVPQRVWTDEETDRWIAWSRRNPQLANRLWPDIVRLLAYGGAGYRYADLLLRRVDRTEDADRVEAAYARCRVDCGALLEQLVSREAMK